MPLVSVKDKFKHYLITPPDLEEEFKENLAERSFFHCPENYLPLLFNPKTPDLELSQQRTRAGSFLEAQVFLRNHFVDRQDPPLLSQDEAEQVRYLAHKDPLFFQQSTEQGEAIIHHEYHFPGQPYFYMEPLTNWYYDFLGHSWFFAPYQDLLEQFEKIPSLNSELQGNWSLNSLWFFTSLARSYTLTGTEIFAGEFLVQLIDWKDKNPCLGGVAWLNPQVVSTRLFHLVQGLKHFSKSPQMSPQLFYQLIETLVEHLVFLGWSIQHQEQYSLTSALALWWGCQEIPELRLAQRFISRAQEVIIEQLEDTQPEDTTQACIWLEWLVACGLKNPEDTNLNALIQQKALQLLNHLEPFNSPGISPTVHQCLSLLVEPQSPKAYLKSVQNFSKLFLRIPLASEPESQEFLWWNTDWIQPRKNIGQEPIKSTSGYSPIIPLSYIHTSTKAQVQLLGERPNHSYHGLSLCLTLEEQPILVHPGNGFHSLPEERHKVTHRFGSNCPTPIVPNKQHLSYTTELTTPQTTEKGYLLQGTMLVRNQVHDIELGVIRRRVLLNPKEELLLIEDTHSFTTPTPIHTGFLFDPDVKVFVRGDRGCVAQNGNQLVRIQPIITKPFDGDLFQASEKPCRGWVTTQQGTITASPMICYLTRPQQARSTSYYLLSWTSYTPPQYTREQLRSWFPE